MFTVKNYSCVLQQTVIMTLLTLCKFTSLYFTVGKPENMALAAVRTTILLIAFYLTINSVISVKNLLFRIILHEAFALIVLSDLLYFKYFNVLPSIRDLQFLKILPSILDSISSLFSGIYILLFADAILLIAHHYYTNRLQTTTMPHRLPLFISVVGLLVLAFTDFSLSGVRSSGLAYENFGLLHYHILQISDFVPSEKIVNDTADIPLTPQPGRKTSGESRLFGIAKGRNVIVIQAEALQDFVLNMDYFGQELTPNLNKLLQKDSIYFNRYYQQLGKGGTSDAEFVSQNSLYPSMDIPAYSKYQNNRFLGLPMIMRERGYRTLAFHAYKPEFWNRQNIYPILGYDRFVNMHNFNPDEIFGWGLSDKYFFEQSASFLKTEKQPFYAFMITLSSHHPFALPKKHKTVLLQPEHEDTVLGRYIQAVRYMDDAFGLFVDRLKEYGLYDNSIIAVYGDHRGIANGIPENDKLMSELLDHEYTFDESLNVPLIIHIPGSGVQETNIIVGGQMDFLPTMLNLLGVEENRLKIFGQDLLNAENGFVASQTNMIAGSFIDDQKIFIMSRDGIFEHSKAWNLSSREPVDLELCRDGYERALRELRQSEYILANDLITDFITMEGSEPDTGGTSDVDISILTRIAEMFKIITR